MHYDEQRLKHLEKQYAEIGETIKQMKEKKKWEPECGYFFVGGDGNVYNGTTDQNAREFGTVRQTRKQAEKARDKMRVFNRLLAYVDGFAPDYEFVVDYENYYIYRDHRTSTWRHSLSHYDGVGRVCMPKQTAIELCEKLNSGEVVL